MKSAGMSSLTRARACLIPWAMRLSRSPHPLLCSPRWSSSKRSERATSKPLPKRMEISPAVAPVSQFPIVLFSNDVRYRFALLGGGVTGWVALLVAQLASIFPDVPGHMYACSNASIGNPDPYPCAPALAMSALILGILAFSPDGPRA